MKMKNKGWRITAQVSRERAGKSCNQRQGYPIIIKGISRFYMVTVMHGKKRNEK